MEKALTKFRSFEEAERADRDFYKKLTPQERLAILLELLNHALSNDSKEFIASLNSRGIEYLIVGAHALAFHASPRFTGELDILIRPHRAQTDWSLFTPPRFPSAIHSRAQMD